MRNLVAMAMALSCCAGFSVTADEKRADSPSHHPDPYRFGPEPETPLFSLEGLRGDDPAGVPLEGFRIGYGSSEEEEFGISRSFWGGYQHGEGQTVTSAGAQIGIFSLGLGPFQLTPRIRLGLEYRAEPPDDGIAGLAGIGIELGVWMGKRLELVVLRDRDFGFPSGTRDVSGAALRWADSPGPRQLESAASRGDRHEVRHLIKSGVRMDKPAAHQALYYAAGLCDRPMIEMLLDAWKGPPDRSSELALDELVRGCEPDLTHLLLDWGQDPDADYYLGGTALMTAADKGKIETARLLLQAGAKVDRRGRYKGHVQEQACRATPLMVAATNGDQQMVDLLLDAGADPILTDASGCTAEEAARGMGHADLAEHIRSRSPDGRGGN